MFNYVPERIYEKIKDDEGYKEIVAFIGAKKATCTTFADYIKSDSDAFYGDKVVEYKTKLENIISKYCPEYLIEYKVNAGEYTRPQLLEMYNSNEYDAEYKFFFLSNIINASYADLTFVQYMEWFINDYELLSPEVLSSLSGYVHLKYMYGKIYLIAFYTRSFGDDYHTKLFDSVHAIYTKTLEYVSADIANNYVLEAMADSVQVIASKVDTDKLISYLELILAFANKVSYQYQKYSYAHAKLLDMKNMFCVYNRDYSGFFNGSIILCRYLSNALAVMPKLLKGLDYYDKCNHALFIVLIRKYIKLKNSVPILRTSNSVVINNLSPDDYNFAISNITNIDTPSAEHDVVVNEYIKSVDKWFNSDNMGYFELKNIKV